jgi:hypothetical protein
MRFYAYRTGTTYDAFDTGDALEPCGVADQILLSVQKELIVKFHEKELQYMIAFRAPKEVQL